jgi:hypothetical protein
MNSKLIVIDGKTYNSVDEMPEDVRQKYERAMNALKDQYAKGSPDVLNDLFGDKGGSVVKSTIKVVVNGKEIHNLDDLPPEARTKYEQAIGALDANHNGIPDFVEGMMGGNTSQTSPTAIPISTSANFGIETPHPPSSAPIPTNSAITPDTSNGLLLALFVLGLLFVCAAGAAGIWYFFLR